MSESGIRLWPIADIVMEARLRNLSRIYGGKRVCALVWRKTLTYLAERVKLVATDLLAKADKPPDTPEKQDTAAKNNGKNQADAKKDAKEKSASRVSARVGPHRYYNYYAGYRGHRYGWYHRR
jgi:hypothetical protein